MRWCEVVNKQQLRNVLRTVTTDVVPKHRLTRWDSSPNRSIIKGLVPERHPCIELQMWVSEGLSDAMEMVHFQSASTKQRRSVSRMLLLALLEYLDWPRDWKWSCQHLSRSVIFMYVVPLTRNFLQTVFFRGYESGLDAHGGSDSLIRLSPMVMVWQEPCLSPHFRRPCRSFSGLYSSLLPHPCINTVSWSDCIHQLL